MSRDAIETAKGHYDEAHNRLRTARYNQRQMPSDKNKAALTAAEDAWEAALARWEEAVMVQGNAQDRLAVAAEHSFRIKKG